MISYIVDVVRPILQRKQRLTHSILFFSTAFAHVTTAL